MPSKKRKISSRFPPARIKKIMQTDEEVGKVAAAVPVIISKALELFIESLILKAAETTKAKNAKTLSAQHIKQTIQTEKNFDFLKELVAKVPDVQPSQQAEEKEESEPKPRGRPRKKKPEDDSSSPLPRKRRKRESTTETDSATEESDEDEYLDDDGEDEEEKPRTTKVRFADSVVDDDDDDYDAPCTSSKQNEVKNEIKPFENYANATQEIAQLPPQNFYSQQNENELTNEQKFAYEQKPKTEPVKTEGNEREYLSYASGDSMSHTMQSSSNNLPYPVTSNSQHNATNQTMQQPSGVTSVQETGGILKPVQKDSGISSKQHTSDIPSTTQSSSSKSLTNHPASGIPPHTSDLSQTSREPPMATHTMGMSHSQKGFPQTSHMGNPYSSQSPGFPNPMQTAGFPSSTNSPGIPCSSQSSYASPYSSQQTAGFPPSMGIPRPPQGFPHSSHLTGISPMPGSSTYPSSTHDTKQSSTASTPQKANKNTFFRPFQTSPPSSAEVENIPAQITSSLSPRPVSSVSTNPVKTDSSYVPTTSTSSRWSEERHHLPQLMHYPPGPAYPYPPGIASQQAAYMYGAGSPLHHMAAMTMNHPPPKNPDKS